MLLFRTPPVGLDGEPPLPGWTSFPDHLNSQTLYYLPAALELLSTADGDPDFFLLRYHGDFTQSKGGWLRFRLGFSPVSESLEQSSSAAGWSLQMVYFQEGRFRLRLRSLQEGKPDDLTDWRSIVPAGRELVAPLLSLTPRETQFLESLLEDSISAVEVEVELHYAGLVPGLPWLVSADLIALRQFLAASLPEEESQADQVIAAFLSLPQGDANPLTFQSLEQGAILPDHETLFTETALRSLTTLFEPRPQIDNFAPTTYRLRPPAPTDPLSLSWDLWPPRQETRTETINWSIRSLLESLDTPEKVRKIFPSVSDVSPFAEVEVHVINRVPYDPNHLREVIVDLRYTGPGGVQKHRSFTFNGQQERQAFKTSYLVAAGGFQLAARFTTVLSPPNGIGWPIVRTGEYTPVEGFVVEINRAALGIDFVRVEAEPGVFVKADSVEVAILANDPAILLSEPLGPLAHINLTVDQPAAWIALPDINPTDDLYAQVIAQAHNPAEVPTVDLQQGLLASRQVHVAAYQLEALDPDRISFTLDSALTGLYAFVQITVASLNGNERTFTLRTDQPVLWNHFRDSIFSPLRYRYCLHYVAINEQGHSTPMVSTEWLETNETSLLVRPPLDDVEAPL